MPKKKNETGFIRLDEERIKDIITGEIFYVDEDDDEVEDTNEIPFGCRSCGGDYPNCKTSCSLFDDDD